MLKIFCAFIVPIFVIGRGIGDGSSYENAFEIELIPNVLRLFTYNEKGATDELHGDLWYAATALTAYNMYVEYGFCIRPSTVVPAAVTTAASIWDCMLARTNVDPTLFAKDAAFATTFELQDRWISAAPATGATTVVTKPDTDSSASLSWKSDTKYS